MSLPWLAFSFALGVIAFTFIEYVHHRHGGHFGWFGKRLLGSHRAHHRDPQEGGVTYSTKLRQRMPLVMGVTVVLVTPVFVLASLGTAVAATSGLLSGYLYSEWFHHRMHHRVPRNAFDRFMWRFHYVHHFLDADSNFGFSCPIWDFVFRTARIEKDVPVPRRFAPRAWPEVVRGFHLRGRETQDT
jgi:dihydroceramide fatty acyl 2-hydroxylase